MMRPSPIHSPILCIAVLLCACAAPTERTAADNSPSVAANTARLSCFSADTPEPGGSCDELCASRDAACVGTETGKGTLVLPLPSCDAASASSTMSCRCCALAQ